MYNCMNKDRYPHSSASTVVVFVSYFYNLEGKFKVLSTKSHTGIIYIIS
ncbi:hypothetical protein SPSIL_024800 [Sporomusa silvacetica DSM 10669]|uniref:Uncharacterized protein n=1 Tax=Sporomusa silvacetica DSM 10669 TaxID=1123289 RepID=A0ABZ3IL54_9FIRM|nr:hypothetical protein SPSIL_01110 [Sporomusa silvacetica DSM 10669]